MIKRRLRAIISNVVVLDPEVRQTFAWFSLLVTTFALFQQRVESKVHLVVQKE